MAQASKAAFFPKLEQSTIIEERKLDKSIERNVEQKGDIYRIIINYDTITPIQYSVAQPIGMVSQFAICAKMSKAVLSVDSQYEQRYYELRFKCISPPPEYDPERYSMAMKLRYCTEIYTPAQGEACKLAGLK